MSALPEVPAGWLAVASAEHVRRGRAGGFMQVCHGKGAPLRRIAPGDGIVCYSPTERLGTADGLKAFTAIGRVRPGEPYRADMGGGFQPWRRDVDWFDAAPAPVRPLLGALDLTAERGWGYRLRFGLIALSRADWAAIGAAMRLREAAHP